MAHKLTAKTVIDPSIATLITPEAAQSILETCNASNRRMRGWWAAALAAAIKRGEWLLTHQGIAFDQHGNLIDGQHRLKAIVLAGIAVKMFVFVGLESRSFMAIDVGVKRSTSDTTGLEKRAAEVCSRLAGLAVRGVGGTAATPQQALQVARCGVEEVHRRLIEFCGSAKKIFTSASVRTAAVLLVMDGYCEERVFTTYRNIALQKYEELPPVALAFIRQANDGKIDTSASKNELLARALKALNPNNASISRLQVSDAEISAAAAYAREIVGRAMAAT
jgi:hypothetical protein